MTTSRRTRATRAILLGLVVVGAALASLPMAEAAKTCRWTVGPAQFECTGEAGCAPGVGFTPSGQLFVGCAAWD